MTAEEAIAARNCHAASYIRELRETIYIDGMRSCLQNRGGGSFANDADDRSNPDARTALQQHYNCVFVISTEKISGYRANRPYSEKLKKSHPENIDRLYLRALRDIMAEEELYVDYGDEYWKEHEPLLRVAKIVAASKPPYFLPLRESSAAASSTQPTASAAAATAAGSPATVSAASASLSTSSSLENPKSTVTLAQLQKDMDNAILEGRAPLRCLYKGIPKEDWVTHIVGHEIKNRTTTPWDIVYHVRTASSHTSTRQWRDADFHGGVNRRILELYVQGRKDSAFVRLPTQNNVGPNSTCAQSCCNSTLPMYAFI